MGSFIDLTGKTFGKLTVIKRAENYVSKRGKTVVRWLCECSCPEHNRVIVRGDALKSGAAQSCGCKQKEMASKANKKFNTYDLSGKYGIGYDCNRKEFYFDLEDYDKIKGFSWHINKRGYVTAYNKNTGGNISFHRLLYPLAETVDHINHNKCDNRKCNLRECSQRENNLNRKVKPSKSSGVTGVYKRNDKWLASINSNGENYNKEFDTLEEAINQRQIWEREYFGEFAYNYNKNIFDEQ